MGRRSDRVGFRAADVATAPYPGLATDLQPPLCVLLSQAPARRSVNETIFEDRLDWLTELARMGADDHRQRPAARHDPRAIARCTAPRSRSATCGPAPH